MLSRNDGRVGQDGPSTATRLAEYGVDQRHRIMLRDASVAGEQYACAL